LLDEPLSLASQDRLQALVDLVTSHLLSDHFEQTFFISHNSTLDVGMFTHHFYIDNGHVMESNLPAETSVKEKSQLAKQAVASTNGYSNTEIVEEPQVMPL
jgi:hypothetical protein